MDYSSSAKKGNNPAQQASVLETLKSGVGKSVAQTLAGEAREIPRAFGRQLFGLPEQKRSTDFQPGEELMIDEFTSGQREENKKLRRQLILERQIRQESEQVQKTKTQELKVELESIKKEILTIAQKTPELDQELKIAAMQAPVEPGEYHLTFFKNLLSFLQSFRKKIEDAAIWLQMMNQRAQKKNYWDRYKQYKGKFLLSGEHYLTRSAG